MSAPRRSWIEHARAELVGALNAASEKFPRAGREEASHVHEARKELKCAASLARLFAPMVGPPAYAALDVVDAARRSVGRARDLDVLPDALASVKCPPETRDILMRAILVERGEARAEQVGPDSARIGAELAAAAAAVAKWDLDAYEIDGLLRSLRGTYRSAKRRGRLAFASADAEELHDLRARVVDLGHQCALFEPAWPAMLSAYGEELRKLRQALGDHNDLTMLGEFALSRRELTAAMCDDLVARVLRRRKPLEKRAAEQFERLFAERPGAFARRFAAYLEFSQHKAPVAEMPEREKVSV